MEYFIIIMATLQKFTETKVQDKTKCSKSVKLCHQNESLFETFHR